MYETPADHPRISKEERDYILEGIKEGTAGKKVGWRVFGCVVLFFVSLFLSGCSCEFVSVSVSVSVSGSVCLSVCLSLALFASPSICLSLS